MSLTKKVAYNTIIQLVGKVITTAISLVLIASITRYLGVNGYGQYTTIFAYVSFWAVLADFGFFLILVREISKTGAQVDKIFNNIVTLRGLLGIIVFSLVALTAFLIPSYPMVVKSGIAVCAFGWFWISMNSTYVGVFQANLEMHWATLTDVLGRIIILGFVLFFIKMNFALNAIILAYCIGNMVNFFASMYFGRRFVHFKPTFDFKYWKKIFYETLPMGIVLILGVLYFKIDTVILSLFKSSKDVGIYGAPFKILEVLLIIPGIFMGNVFPIITRYLEKNDERLQSAFQKSFDFLSLMALPVVFGALVLARPIINFIAGQEFVDATTMGPFFGLQSSAPLVLQILIITVGIYYISQLFNNTVIAMGRQKEMVKPYIIITLLNIGLNLIAIPHLSYIGAALVTIITAASVLYFTAKIVFGHKELKINFVVFGKALVSALIMGSILFLLKINLLLAILLGILVYFFFLYIFKAFTKDTIRILLNKSN